MLRSSILFFAITACITISTAVYAESFFLKDGSIIEGQILAETDFTTKIKQTDDKITIIERTKIIRVLYDTNYRKRSYIKLTGGKMVEGHIVEESSTEYTLRDKLDSPAEYKLDKKDVVAVSAEKMILKGGYYALGIIPGAAQFYAGKDVEGGIFLGTFLGATGFLTYAYIDYEKKRKDYRSIPRGSGSTAFDSAFTDYQNSSYVLIAACSVWGLVYIMNWIDVLFIAKPDFGQQKKAGLNRVFFNISSVSMGDPLFTSGPCGDRNFEMLRTADTSHYYCNIDPGLYISAGMRF